MESTSQWKTKVALVRSNNPNSVPPTVLPLIGLATSDCCSLPGASGRHVTGALLRLLPSVGPFHRFQADPQQNYEALHHGQFLLGRVVSAPRARFSPPCFRRTGVDTELGVSSAFYPRTNTVSHSFAPRPLVMLYSTHKGFHLLALPLKLKKERDQSELVNPFSTLKDSAFVP